MTTDYKSLVFIIWPEKESNCKPGSFLQKFEDRISPVFRLWLYFYYLVQQFPVCLLLFWRSRRRLLSVVPVQLFSLRSLPCWRASRFGDTGSGLGRGWSLLPLRPRSRERCTRQCQVRRQPANNEHDQFKNGCGMVILVSSFWHKKARSFQLACIHPRSTFVQWNFGS